MDSERQCLLAPTASEIRYNRTRPLSYEEVLTSRRELPWKSARICLILIFWAVMAAFLSIIASILSNNNCSFRELDSVPSVPPVHMSFGPLVS
ncbi:unnamed protein product, partial [Brenthis ino]